MISDVLHDAVREIERYQRDFADTYDEMRNEIDGVRASMDALRAKLDRFPSALRSATKSAALKTAAQKMRSCIRKADATQRAYDEQKTRKV